jgi:hypothetical protein
MVASPWDYPDAFVLPVEVTEADIDSFGPRQ